MKFLKFLYGSLEQIVAVLCLASMLAGLTFQTVARYFFHYSTSWIEEFSGYGLIWLVFTAASYAVLHKAHIGIDSAMSLYPQKIKKYVEVLGKIAWLIFSIIMVYEGMRYTMQMFAKGSRAVALPLPLGAVYFAIPFGHACMSIRLLETIVRHIIDIRNGVDFMHDALKVTTAEDTGEDFEGGK
jgi:C4-dicarboxylate transporter DctQ subunit